MASSSARRLDSDAYVRGVEAGDRAVLARAITLIESERLEDRRRADEVLSRLMGRTGAAHRVGITGVPGVGKSTVIDRIGMRYLERGERVAVLAIDPTSTLSGGSILGDKTRMQELSMQPDAFIRPSPSAKSLGGVARRTRETMLLCEAAGFSVVLVETVGVGQSETMVADMVDTFALLLLPGAGDELQGIKRGIVEVADVVSINKADGPDPTKVAEAKRAYSMALRFFARRVPAWKPPVLTMSAVTLEGIDAFVATLDAHRETLRADGALDRRRAEQARSWMWSRIGDGLMSAFRQHPDVAAELSAIVAAVEAGELAPTIAAERLLARFVGGEGT